MFKKVLATFLSIAVIAQMCGTTSVDVQAATKNEAEFVRGVDVSTLEMLEELGAKYYENGKKKDETLFHPV